MTNNGEKCSAEFHNTHCLTCINLSQCKIKDQLENECPIVRCSNKCHQRFHLCKTDEHELLCPNVKVNCINYQYGCPVVLERKERGVHLQRCPASVIACTMEWNRWPLRPETNRPFELNSRQLDSASTLRDENTILKWKTELPHSLQKTLRNYMTGRHPVMPLGVSASRIPLTIQDTAKGEKLRVSLDEISSESELNENSDTPWGEKNSPPGLICSLCSKLNSTLKVEPNPDDIIKKPCENNDNKIEKKAELKEYKVKKIEGIENQENKKVELSLVVEVITRYLKKPDQIYTFMCAEEFRRDEFASHFKNVHAEIETQLNGWLFTRCPVANYGCSFGIERLFPYNSSHEVVLNDELRTFYPKTKENENEAKEKAFNLVSLGDLPVELLIHLTKFLDPLSLSSLSMVNKEFRRICETVLLERGIVVLQWEKKESKWDVVSYKWLFTTSFTPIKNWSFGDIGRMANHMKSCPSFERNVKTEPFSYGVTLDQL